MQFFTDRIVVCLLTMLAGILYLGYSGIVSAHMIMKSHDVTDVGRQDIVI